MPNVNNSLLFEHRTKKRTHGVEAKRCSINQIEIEISNGMGSEILVHCCLTEAPLYFHLLNWEDFEGASAR